jgi:hypothetical protein
MPANTGPQQLQPQVLRLLALATKLQILTPEELQGVLGQLPEVSQAKG